MAFQSMLNGADCSTSSNPLSQLLKHSNADSSLQQDRTQSSSSNGNGGINSSFRQSQGPPPNATPQEVDAFFRQQQQQQQMGMGPQSNFSMEAMRREMESMRGAGAAGVNGGSDWSQEINRNARAPNAMNVQEMEAAFNRGQFNMNGMGRGMNHGQCIRVGLGHE